MTIWVIEESVFGKDKPKLDEAAQQFECECRWLSMDQEASGRYGNWTRDDAVVFRGSFEAAEAFRSARKDAWPGVIGDQSGLNCASYYPMFGENLLNTRHIYLPVGDLQHDWKALQSEFQSQSLFVRPDTGAKAFSGQLVTDLSEFLIREKPYLASMNSFDLCVVAPPKRILAEYRLVVIDQKIVASCRYKLDSSKSLDPMVPTTILEFGQTMASTVKLKESAYMLDIAEEESGRLSVIEVNSFSSSDFYEADLVPVVRAIEEMIHIYKKVPR